MNDRKIIFVQCEKAEASEVGRCLGSIDQHDYHFVISPKSIETMTREDVEEFLQRILKNC